jgi:hypothetical protein
MVVAHTGTACSTRQRGGEPQSWQLINFEGDQLDIFGKAWDSTENRFVAQDQSRFNRSSSGWQQVSAGS